MAEQQLSGSDPAILIFFGLVMGVFVLAYEIGVVLTAMWRRRRRGF